MPAQRPDDSGRKLFRERRFIDVAIPCSYRISSDGVFVGAGLAPRLSILVEEHQPSTDTKYSEDLLVRVIFFGFGVKVHL